MVIVVGIAIFGFCQWGYGQARPHIPDPVRSIVGGEKELDVEEYLRSVPRAFERFVAKAEGCKVEGDQRCLTQAVKDTLDDIGDGVSASASWMADAHGQLRAAVIELLEVNRLSETEQTEALTERVLDAQYGFGVAIEEWLSQAQR